MKKVYREIEDWELRLMEELSESKVWVKKETGPRMASPSIRNPVWLTPNYLFA